MMGMNLQQVFAWIESREPRARLVGDGATPLARVHTDTRTLQPGDLFVALRGERFDAHDFLAQARASGAVVHWRVEPSGFAFDGLGDKVAKDLPDQWQNPDTRAELRNDTLLLGPDPVLPPQSVRLWQADQRERSLWVASDGLRPFAVRADAP